MDMLLHVTAARPECIRKSSLYDGMRAYALSLDFTSFNSDSEVGDNLWKCWVLLLKHCMPSLRHPVGRVKGRL